MKRKRSVLFIIAAALLIAAVLCLVASMILQAVFNSSGASAVLEVVCSGTACVLAFAGIILACLSNNKAEKGEKTDCEKSE